MADDWRELSQEFRANTLALELLRRNITNMPQAIAANASRFYGGGATTGGGGTTGGKGGGMMGVLTSVIGKFAAVLGPLAILGSVLSANISGFNLLMSAVRVVATTLAPILLPVMAVLAAALLAASEVIWAQMLPALEDWYRFILSNMIPAIIEMVNAFLDAADWITRQIDSLSDPLGSAAEGLGLADSKDSASSDIRDAMDALRDRIGAMQSDGPGGFGAAMGRGMDDVIKSLQMSLGPKAQQTDMVSVWKNAQMAALNADPLEMRMLKISQQSLEMLGRIWNEQKAGNKSRVSPGYGSGTGAGDWDRGGGSGGGSTSINPWDVINGGGNFNGDF